MLQISVNGLDKRPLTSRRLFLRTSLATAGALSLPSLLEQRATAAATAGRAPKDTAVILLWLAGGPSHMDMYDMKPEAPVEYRGFYRPIRTNVSGIDICELMPRQAKLMDRLSILRSMHIGTSEHPLGTAWMATGYEGPTLQNEKPVHPCAGSITAKLRGPNSPGMMPYVHIAPPPHEGLGNIPYHSATYLGPTYDPFLVRSARKKPDVDRIKLDNLIGKVQFEVPNLQLLPDMEVGRLQDRAHLLKQVDQLTRLVDTTGVVDAMGTYHAKALSMLTSQGSRTAFDLSREDPRLRQRYGMNAWGQGALLARRLVEAGVTFVTLNTDSSFGQWDTHQRLKPQFDEMLPVYDQLLATLIEDLEARGLYDRVLVVVCGDFGRTPKVNRHAGRDHWGPSGFALLGGGGLQGGVVVGSTTAKGEVPKTRPLGPEDLWATVYHVLGIDPRHEFPDHAGRPFPISTGDPVHELL